MVSTSSIADPLVKSANINALSTVPLSQVVAVADTSLVDEESEQFKATIKEALKKFQELKWVQVLPVENLVMMQSPSGDYVLIDTKSRIAIRGELEVYDLWNQTKIKTLHDAKSSWLIDLDRFAIKEGDLAKYRFGLKKDKPDMRVFVDPTSEYNLVIFNQMKALADKYAFEIILAPILTADSITPTISIWCNRDQEQSLKHLMSGESFQSQMLATCDKKPILNSLGVLQLLNVTKVPFVLRADGIHSMGAPNDLSNFMTREKFEKVPDTPI